MRNKRFRKLISVAIIATLLITQTSIVSADTTADDLTDESDIEFIEPAPMSIAVDNEYRKEDFLRLPESDEENQDDAYEELYGQPIAVSEHAKVYSTGEEEYKTVFSEIPNTYRDTFGTQHEIDNTLVKMDDGFSGEYFKNRANSLSAMFPFEMNGGSGVVISKDGVAIKLIPTEGDYTKITAKDNAVLYNEVFDYIDVQYTAYANFIKEDIILRKYTAQNVFRYEIEAPGAELRKEDGVINIYKWNKSTPILSIAAPQMSDAAGAWSENVTLDLETVLGQYHVTVTADSSWLDAPERAYPVKIDPNVSIPAGALDLTTTSIYKGVNRGKAYGYSGYIDGVDIGMSPAETFGETRMYIQVYDDLSGIPSNAEIRKAELIFYQYADYSHGTTKFYSYQLMDSWNPDTLTWSGSVGIGRNPSGDTIEDPTVPGRYMSPESTARVGFHYFNVTETLNDWKKGISPNYGLMIKTEPETSSIKGGAFFTPYSSSSGGGQGSFTPDKAPYIEIDWYIPGDVPDRPLDDITVELRPISESTIAGRLRFNGIFADGISKPGTMVTYSLNDTSKNFKGIVPGGYWFKYPNSSEFDQYFPGSNKYSYKKSNWQTPLPFVNFDFNMLYNFSAYASLDGVDGAPANSENFVAYKIKQYDTLPKIANYYGVNLAKMMYDNRVQDILLFENNTIFIRNPQRNATIPYNPPPLTADDKREIDSGLNGRGFQCEFDMEPVNMNTGNFYLSKVDISIPDINDDFLIERNYNSKDSGNFSLFGRGWSFSYDEQLSLKEDGTVVYARSDGSSLYFHPDGLGGFIPPAGRNLSLKKVRVSDKTMDFGNEEDETRPIYEYEIIDNDGATKRFNAFGMLSYITDINGLSTTINYDENFNIESVISPSNLKYDFTLTNGMISEIIVPGGKSLKYTYDASQNLTISKDLMGNETKYSYDSKHQMTAWYDQNGTKVIGNTYDGEGRVVKQEDGIESISTLAYEDGHTQATDANGNVTDYYYDGQFKTTSIVYPDGGTVYKEYDSENNLSAETDQMGHRTAYVYDVKGHLLSLTRFDGMIQSYEYDSIGHMVRFVDFDGSVTEFRYNATGKAVEQTFSDGEHETYTYDTLQRMTSKTDSNGNTTNYEYSGNSAWISASTDSLSAKTKYQYNAYGQITHVTDALNGVVKYTYDAEGRMTGVENQNGKFTEYIYDKAGNKIAEIDAEGHRTDFEINKVGLAEKAIDALGHIYLFSYDKMYNLISDTDAGGSTTTYDYDSMNRLTRKEDGDGNETLYEYDFLGNIVKATDSNGNETIYEYDYVSGEISKTIAPDLSETLIEYSLVSLPVRHVYPDGGSREYTYDVRGRLSTFKNELGLVMQCSYDPNGNLIEVRDDEGRITEYSYDKVNRQIWQRDSVGAVRENTFDALGRLISSEDPLGNISSIVYDSVGNILSITDPKGMETEFSYDNNANRISVTDPAGHKTEMTYDPLGNLRTIKNPDGTQELFGYDINENLVLEKNEIGAETTYEYNSMGLPVKQINPDGEIYKMSYDGNGNYLSVTGPTGNKIVRNYDSNNRVKSLGHSNGLIEKIEYDRMGRTTKTSDNTGSLAQYSYDAAGNITKVTDALGRTNHYEYNKAGDLISERGFDGNLTSFEYDLEHHLIAVTDPEGKRIKYSYDLAGRLTEKEDSSGRIWRYTYDEIGELTEAVSPLGTIERYEYNNNGNLTTLYNADGNPQSYSYDAMSRPVQYTDANGNITTFEYDAAGRTHKRISSDGGETVYSYDLMSRVIAEKDTMGSITQYSYDHAGQLTSVSLPNDGEYKYEYNASGDVIKEINPLGFVTKTDYDLLGHQTKRTLSNGSIYTYDYDSLGRIIDIKTPENQSRTFLYDAFGNLSEEKDHVGRNIRYDYDKMHRLVKETNPNGLTTTYGYDDNGNMSNITTPRGSVTGFVYDVLDRAIQITDEVGSVMTVDYDDIGNVNSITRNGTQTTKFAYDKNSNLISEINPLGHISQLIYDEMGRVVSETDPRGAVTEYQYDLGGRLISTTNADNVKAAFTYDKMGNLISDSGRSYGYDLLGRLTSVSDKTGQETKYSYDVTGNLTERTVATGNTWAYEYDTAGRLIEETNPLGERIELSYDRAGMVNAMIKPDGKIIEYDYDKLDAMVSADYTGAKEVDGKAMYAYDESGHLIDMKDLTGETVYEYDAAGRVTKVIQSDGNEIAYTYDVYGNISTLNYPDKTTVNYVYDGANRLTKITDRNRLETTYAYDENGNLTDVLRPNGTHSVSTYDILNRVIKVTNYDAADATLSSFSYVYSEAGNITSESVIQGDIRVDRTFSYNDRNELIKVKEDDGDQIRLVEYTHDEVGNRLSLMESRGFMVRQVSYEYNDAGRLVSENDSIYGTKRYEYDKNGNVISTSDGNRGTLTYEYDTENRLKAVKDNGTLLMAALYDGNGDRVFSLSRKTSIGTDITSERIEENPLHPANGGAPALSAGGEYNVFDERIYKDPKDTVFWYGYAQGSINSMELLGQTCAHEVSSWFNRAWYEFLNLFEKITHREKSEDGMTSGTADESLQDADSSLNSGNREMIENLVLIPYGVKESVREDYDLRNYVNDVNTSYTQVLMEYGSDGAVRNVYDYGQGRNSFEHLGQTSYYTYDGRGSVSNLTAASGSSDTSYYYDAYGGVSKSSYTDNPFDFNAEATDYATGMQYLRARYYDTSVGRFITEDTYQGDIYNPLSHNKYSYTMGNPVSNIDPSGHIVKELIMAGTVIAGVATLAACDSKSDEGGAKTGGSAPSPAKPSKPKYDPTKDINDLNNVDKEIEAKAKEYLSTGDANERNRLQNEIDKLNKKRKEICDSLRPHLPDMTPDQRAKLPDLDKPPYVISPPASPFEDALDKQMALSKPKINYGTGFVNATREEVRAYMEPTKYYNDPVQKFQFLDVHSVSGLTAEQLNAALIGQGLLANMGAYFIEAEQKYHVNAIYLAAHAIWETGHGNSKNNYINGTYKVNGQPVYNTYGVGAFDTDPDSSMQYAYEAGWFSLGEAIVGGGNFVNTNFSGQNTLYEMRWNPSNPATHQYATDVKWAYGIAQIVSNLYENAPGAKMSFTYPTYR